MKIKGIAWRKYYLLESKKQNVVSSSFVEAEYKAMTSLICELICVKGFLKQLDFREIQPMEMYCDNQDTLPMASNPVFHKRIKHV